ncbi:hypothetical protein [Wolinella succinogenes]|uniref:hypothetical protein n=1 Tax=Wolinella succinogenes TaxID=844 RepID=UPI0024099922|nr:hypothetical protein [Wolinella succinogenes]
MELEELRSYFEESYRFLHEYDEPLWERENIKRLFQGIKERLTRLEEAFAPNGANLPMEIGGRFFFVYQNGSWLFKYALLAILEKGRNGGAWIDRGFLKINPSLEREKYAQEFQEIEEKIISLGLCLQDLT